MKLRRLLAKKIWIMLLFVLCGMQSTYAQNTILNLAGTGEDEPSILTTGGLPSSAHTTGIDHPYGLAIDCGGNVFISEQECNIILKVNSGGTISLLSGYAVMTPGGTFDLWPGSGTVGPWPGWPVASLNSCNMVIGMSPAPGDVCSATDFAGDGTAASSSNRYGLPSGMVYDPVNDNLLIADPKNNRIRAIHSPGTAGAVLNTYAGTTGILINGAISESGGEPSCGEIMVGTGLAVDGAGFLYIADNGHNQILKIPPGGGGGIVVAGNGSAGSAGDGGVATSAQLNRPTGVAVDRDGNVYIADYFNNKIRKVNVGSGIITTIAGTGTQGFGGDMGTGTSALLAHPVSVAVDDAGRKGWLIETY